MQIAGLKSTTRAILGSAIIALPIVGCSQKNIVEPTENPSALDSAVQRHAAAARQVGVLDPTLTQGLKDTTLINMRGGATKTYTDSSLEILKERILDRNIHAKYSFPIDTAYKPYISNWGVFGAPRGNRPHLGIDIYTTKAGKKPKEPVAVLSPIDGIVISQKKSLPKNKIIGNITKIMGVDGKIYTFDHMAKASDYPNYREIPLKNVGAIAKTNDTLGIVGNTGETAVWHLHLSVQDLDVKKQQAKNPAWQELYHRFKDFAKPEGQVDPLDSTKAGKITQILKTYKIEGGKIKILPIMKQL